MDWNAAAGLLHGIYSTLWKSPYIASMPNLKSLIGTCQCLVVGEDSLTSISDHHGPATKRPELPPQSFCSIVFQLVALQVISLLLLSHHRPIKQALFLCNICVVFTPVFPFGYLLFIHASTNATDDHKYSPLPSADFDIAVVLVSFSAFIFS